MKPFTLIVAIVVLATATGYAQAPPAQGQTSQGGGGRQGRGGGQTTVQGSQPPRDTQTPTVPTTSSITGRVLTADTGRPVKRAQVMVSASGRGGRGAMTDDQGVYSVTALAAGSYTVTASKNGFVDAIYGQRRPLQPGAPIQLLDNQQANIDLRLIRGGVITGRVLDEDGEPLMRAVVSIQRYQYLQGNRQLTPAGVDQTDDRGVYRVFGLPAGDYYVSVNVSGLGQTIGRGLQQLAMGAGAFGPGGGRGGRGGFGALDEAETSGYAPTYYPGVVTASEAGKVTVGPGQEVSGIDFQIQLVPFATVAGSVGGADSNGGITVTLAPQDTHARGPLGGTIMNGRTAQDGSFSIRNVPPGRYLAIARSGGRQNDQRIGVQPVVVNGQNTGGLAITLQPEITMSGNIVVQSAGTPSPTDYSAFRVDAPEVTPLPFGGGGPAGRGGGPFGTSGRAAANGSFSIPNLVPGRHYVRITGQGLTQGLTTGTQWILKAVIVGGADVTDSGVDLKPGENIDNATIVLTDQATSLTGTVRDASSTPVPALTVIAFAADPQYWTPQSRWIQAGRTDQNGTYHLRGLPPGDYLVLVSDNVEQGEWFDPSFLEQVRNAATRITLGEGDQKTQDLSAPGGT